MVSLEKKIGVKLWQHDLWWTIIVAALAGHPDQVDLSYHPALDQPALSQYAATTPKLLRWFNAFNQNLPYERQVKPFGFLYSLFAHTLSGDDGEHILMDGAPPTRRRLPDDCKPVAPYDRNLSKAVARCFDRETGLPVAADALKSFKQVIALYHLHPESKFLKWGLSRPRSHPTPPHSRNRRPEYWQGSKRMGGAVLSRLR